MPITSVLGGAGVGALCVMGAMGAAWASPTAHAAVPRSLAVARASAPAQTLTPTPDAQRLRQWVLSRQDNEGAAFVIIDKRQAHLWLYDPQGGAMGDSAVLLGLARGDRSVAGIGERAMEAIRAEERTTPAGRFSAQPDHNVNGEDIFWVDYDAAVSMHRVRATNPKERRLQRLATPTPAGSLQQRRPHVLGLL